jgi:hypothetical protein
MTQRFLYMLVLCLSLISTGFTKDLPPQKATPNKWIQNWLICGPIPLESTGTSKTLSHLPGYQYDYLQKYGGESNLRIGIGNEIALNDKKIKWFAYTTPDSIVDLRKVVSQDSPVFAYAYTEIQADQDEMYFIALGSNDGGSLFVNGLRVWDYSTDRSLVVDSDIIPIHLKKGTNKLLFKIEQRGNQWGFCARLQSFSTAKLLQRGDLFRIESKNTGEISLKSVYSPSVLTQLIKSVQIDIKNARDQTVLAESRQAHFQGILNLVTDHFHTYTAHFEVMLQNGEKIQQQIPFDAGVRQEYTLFNHQKTNYAIVLGDSASDSEKWAAQELQHWLKEASGAHFPIQKIAESKGPKIIVGYNELIKDKTDLPAPAILDESYIYENIGRDILIFGGSQRGTMYGVMSFLENELGCRWYTPTTQHIPKQKELIFTKFGHREKPGIRVRNNFYYEAFDPIWSARNKMNGSMSTPVQPGGVESYWQVHTFYPLVPPNEFFELHPEYYSQLGGKRVSELAQLCLSNPDVLHIITDRIKKKMRESPEYLIYDVSQNDYYNPCECDQCQSIVKREGSESGLMIWFVNQVAQAVEKEFPDKFIGTLAYQYTRNPPSKIKPRNNVVVRFCSIECCFSHDFKSCPKNQSFMNDLTTWATLAPHLYIWDYVVNFGHYLMPYANFNVLQSNIKTFQENNAIGIMEQAAYQSRGGEFAELRAYLIAKLLWNPEINTQAVIDDFMHGYYGRAGMFIRHYFNLLQSRVTPDRHIGLSTNTSHPLFSEEFVRKSTNLFEEALKVSDHPEIKRRVEMAYLPILYLKCKRTPSIAHYDGSYKKFCEITEREQVTFFSEGGKPEVDAFHDFMMHAD